MRRNFCHVLIIELVQMVDQGKHAGVSIEDVHEHIKAHDVIPWLRSRHPGSLKNSTDAVQIAEIADGLDRVLNAYGGDERKRWGIENSGLCLLIDWVLELTNSEAD